ncbi:unnamed protein product [Caretta caretta]
MKMKALWDRDCFCPVWETEAKDTAQLPVEVPLPSQKGTFLEMPLLGWAPPRAFRAVSETQEQLHVRPFAH